MEKRELSIIFGAGLVLTAAIWGFAFVVVKDSLDFVGPTWMVAIRFTIAAICFGLIFIKRFQHLNKDIFFTDAFWDFFCFWAILPRRLAAILQRQEKTLSLQLFM